MPLDGTTLASIVHELNTKILGGRIDKISQPEPDETVLAIRAGGANYKLLLTANASAPRLGFTTQSKTSPLKAPMFCMVLRKHLMAGRVLNIRQPDFERIVEIEIEAMDEMGDRARKILLIEIMGKHSNIMLVDAAGKILDSIKHVPMSVSAVRPILPNIMYSRPASKHNPLAVKSLGDFSKVICPGNPKVQQALYQQFNGISPVMATEICTRAAIDCDMFVNDLADHSALYNAFAGHIACIESGNFSNSVYTNADGIPSDISAVNMVSMRHYTQVAYDSPSAMLEVFYSQREEAYRVRQKTVDMRKLVSTLLERCRKKAFAHQRDMQEVQGRDILRVKGELVTAYLYDIPPGAASYTAYNFYTDTALEIQLDPAHTAAENAQRFFKMYNKQKRTFAAVTEQMQKNEEELAYLESVAIAMETIDNEADIAEIREELASLGFAKRQTKGKKVAQVTQPLRYTSTDGFEIHVGKNNTQNDNLTMRLAAPQDIWLHAKGIPGSHVIIVCAGKEPPHTTILEAANLAAYYSKARTGAQVPVDYVAKKHVKKPNGARPGFVIYDNHKTVYVTPSL